MAIPEIIKQSAKKIRDAVYGGEVQESLAKGIEDAGEIANDSKTSSDVSKATALAIQEKYKEQLLSQDLNPNKDPELVDLRGGKDTAGERITAFEQSTTAQFQQTEIEIKSKASQIDLDSGLAAALDGGPSIYRNTYALLVADYPDGASGTALVFETDPAYIYIWQNGEWTKKTQYTGVQLKDGTVSRPKLDAYLSGYNNNKTELRYEGGMLVEVVEKDGDLTISRVNLFYTDGKLTQITERADRRLITTNLTYHTDGRLSYTQNILGGE